MTLTQRPITFTGLIHGAKDLSGIAVMGDYLITSSDEGHVVQILKKHSDTDYHLHQRYSLISGLPVDHTMLKPEFDIEAITVEGNDVFVIGSHSAKRMKVTLDNEKNLTRKENIIRLAEVRSEKARRVLFKFTLDNQGNINGGIESISLWKAIKKFPILQPFMAIPSKENGIDIEGLTRHNDTLYIGFRGPILRQNWVPILTTTFDKSRKNAELIFVNLGGFGIRDIVFIRPQHFIILAGPMGDHIGNYQLFSWNGLDCIPDKAHMAGKVDYLATLDNKDGGKAEGIALLSEPDAKTLRLLVLFDGKHNGSPIEVTLS